MTDFDPALRDDAVRLYDAYTHDHRDRRTLLRQMTALAGSAAAAEALILGIAATPAAASIVPADDARLQIDAHATLPDGQGTLKGYVAAPRGARPRGTVIVLHENRGLNAHIEDVARRVALAGFVVIAPDLLTDQGGTPADEDRARALIAAADLERVVAETVGLARHYAAAAPRARVGVIGFCWGGALTNRVALAAGPVLSAAVSYYGPAPAPSEAAKLTVPLMLHYAGKDARVAQTGAPWVAALKAARKPVEAFTYPGVDHAFNNDTSAERYDKAAADLAWGRTIAFLHKHLDR
ncbi:MULTISPECIES: dienelactone hydrolase family protein [Sphingomonas]|uniref:dienelactone hydrolase family protein n=1 Tax=Sphingomonas TaxID=13687 RepID=UPI0008336632|nr:MULTISPECIES: dienelactone hydrolase family protein [Sphingomonas]MBY0300721.1 dienelactone hydrolase family protein [Sphingomonas ginsenosidimutans]